MFLMPNLLRRNKMIQTDRRNFHAQLLSDSTNKFAALPGDKKLPFVSLWSNLCFAACCSEVMDTSQHTHLWLLGAAQAPQAACSSQNGSAFPPWGRQGRWPSLPHGSHRLGLCLEEGVQCWSGVPSSGVAPWGRGAPQRPFVLVLAGSHCCLWKQGLARLWKLKRRLSK